MIYSKLRHNREPEMLSPGSVWILATFLVAVPALNSQTVSTTGLQQAPVGQQQSSVAIQGASTAISGNHPLGPSVAPEDVADMRLMPGSSVDLHVFEEPDLDGTYRLDKEGSISLPLAGSVQLQSLTLREAEVAINAKLVAAQILRTPHSVVNLDENSAQNIVVMGEVGFSWAFPCAWPAKINGCPRSCWWPDSLCR